MSENPSVSIIMIFRNAAQFMEEAVRSVFDQTYQHWKLLLVDDGSTDQSRELGLKYCKGYPDQVIYLYHPGHQNRGMSASRNLGIWASVAEYIAFLDADDVYLPGKLENQVRILAEHPEAGMVYGATEHWHSWTGRPEDQRRDVRRNLGVSPDTLVPPPALIPLYLQRKAQTPGTCGVLIRRQAILAVGGLEEQFRGMFEDQVLMYKLGLHFPIFVEGGSWDRYRQHTNSHSIKRAQKGSYSRDGSPNRDHYQFLSWLETYLEEHGLTNPEVWRALQREIWPYRHPNLYQLKTILRRAELAPNRAKSLVAKLRNP